MWLTQPTRQNLSMIRLIKARTYYLRSDRANEGKVGPIIPHQMFKVSAVIFQT